jgi:hypothetical protein
MKSNMKDRKFLEKETKKAKLFMNQNKTKQSLTINKKQHNPH